MLVNQQKGGYMRKAFGKVSMDNEGYNKVVINIDDDFVDETLTQYDGAKAEDGRAIWNMIGKVGADVILVWADGQTFNGTVTTMSVSGSAIYAHAFGTFSAEEGATAGALELGTSAADPGTNGEGKAMLLYVAYSGAET